MKNFLTSIPYQEDRMGHRELVNEKDLLIMQIALKGGQSVPAHKANSNVHLLLQCGRIEVDLDGDVYQLKTGDVLPVAFGTPMKIKNAADENATFLVLKTPNPSEMKNRKNH